MFKGLGNIATLLNQARNMGGQMEGISEALKGRQVTGEAGGAMVKAHANGLGQILSVEVDPILMEKRDVEMIVDLLPTAINDAIVKSKALHMEAVQEITGEMELPSNLTDTLKQFLGQSSEFYSTDETKPDDRS